jgi:hypothetical protein
VNSSFCIGTAVALVSLYLFRVTRHVTLSMAFVKSGQVKSHCRKSLVGRHAKTRRKTSSCSVSRSRKRIEKKTEQIRSTTNESNVENTQLQSRSGSFDHHTFTGFPLLSVDLLRVFMFSVLHVPAAQLLKPNKLHYVSSYEINRGFCP